METIVGLKVKTFRSVVNSAANSPINIAKVLALILSTVILISVFPGQVLITAQENPPQRPPGEQPLTDREKDIVKMAVDILGLVGENDNLTTKIQDQNIDDPEKGIASSDRLPDGVAGMGWPDDGKIVIKRDKLDSDSYPDKFDIDSVQKLVDEIATMGRDRFAALVALAELLRHENTHNKQKSKEQTASQEAFKRCNSHWIELEAHYAELLFKLKLRKAIEGLPNSPEKTAALEELDRLIDELLKRTRDRVIKVGNVEKKMQGSDAAPSMDDVYGKDKTTDKRIEDVGKRKDEITQKRKSLVQDVDNQRIQSQGQQINPDTGGIITLPSGSAKIMVPIDSLSVPTYVEIHEVNLTGLPRGHNTLTSVFEVSPEGLVFNASFPACLTIAVSNPQAIQYAYIYCWEPISWDFCFGGWRQISSGRIIDTINNTVSANIEESGYYVVIDDQSCLEVDPATTNVNLLNSIVQVNVTIACLELDQSLVSVQFRLCYNDTLLSFLSATEGPFLKYYANEQPGSGGTIFVTYQENHTTYGPSVIVGAILLPNASGAWNPPFPRGSGVLATICLKAAYQERGLGKPPLECNLTLVETDVRNDQNTALSHTKQDGLYRIWPTNIADINYDGKVDLKDYYRVVKAYGSFPGYPKWDPMTDLNNDGRVDLKDVYICAKAYGWIRNITP